MLYNVILDDYQLSDVLVTLMMRIKKYEEWNRTIGLSDYEQTEFRNLNLLYHHLNHSRVCATSL